MLVADTRASPGPRRELTTPTPRKTASSAATLLLPMPRVSGRDAAAHEPQHQRGGRSEPRRLERHRRVHPKNKLRFIWFGGEEPGLLGSDCYVSHLSPAGPGRISYDLDADVTATPNYLIGVLDPAAPDLFGRTVTATFPDNVYEPSKIARDMGCDNLSNNDPEVMTFMSRTFGNMASTSRCWTCSRSGAKRRTPRTTGRCTSRRRAASRRPWRRTRHPRSARRWA
jgi:hypothetical protein